MLKKYQIALIFMIVGWVAFSTSASAQVSVSGWTPPATSHKKTRLTMAERVAVGEAPLSLKYAQLKIESARLYRLEAPSSEALKQKGSRKKLRVGIVRPLTEGAGLLSSANLFTLPEGRVRIFRVASDQAAQVRLHFTQFSLPDGARVFVSSAKNRDEFYGPFQGSGPDGNGNFWTPPVSGDEVVIEYFTPESSETSATSAEPFKISEVSHVFTDVSKRAALTADCQLNIPAEWSEASKSTGLLQFTLPDGEYVCSGTLLNTTSNSGEPFLLTANHCISTANAARSVKVYWLFDAAGQTPEQRPSSYGSKLLATGEATDFTFVRLNNPAPAGVKFAGWTTAQANDGEQITGIHHPDGEYKRISFGNIVNQACSSFLSSEFCEAYLKARWTSGVTSEGSSGSGVFVGGASDPKLVGALTGGASSCSNPSGVDFYGRFDLTYQAISSHLTGAGCAYLVTQKRLVIGANGGTGSIDLLAIAGEQCAWTANASSSWIAINSGASGSGDGSVGYTIAPNTGAARRVGLLAIGGHQIIVNQLGATETCATNSIEFGQTVNGELNSTSCRFALDNLVPSARYSFTAGAGQQVAINVNSSAFDSYVVLYGPLGEKIAEDDDSGPGLNSRIPLPATHSYNFITLPANGTYTIEVTSPDENPAGAFAVKLEKSCSYTVTQKKLLVGATGRDYQGVPTLNGEIEVEIKGDTPCTFYNATDENWMRVSDYGNFTSGKGKISLDVQYNLTGRARSGFVNVAGIPVLIKQAAFCGATNRPAITPNNQSFPASGGRGSIDVTMAPSAWCSWEIGTTRPNWIGLISPPDFIQGGTGNGKIDYSVYQDISLKPRTGTLDISGNQFTVTRAPSITGCSPAALSFDQVASGNFRSGDCRWRPDSEALADLYTFEGSAGQQIAINLSSSNFPVYFLLFGPNQEPGLDSSSFYNQNQIRVPQTGYYNLPASGTYTLLVTATSADQTGAYSLKVESLGGAGCVYSIELPDEQNFPATGGTGGVKFTATSGCSWNIVSSSDWITFPEGASGQGAKNIAITVAPNAGAERRGFLTVGGRTFRIFQHAPCSYVKLMPEGKKLYWNPNSGSVTVYVETGIGCTITAASRNDWIKLDRAGGGQAVFILVKNTGGLRKGSVEVSGQTVDVFQGAANLSAYSAADYKPAVAAGGIAAIFGELLTPSTEAAATIPLPTYLGATGVRITFGAASYFAPLFYVSPAQVNFQIPEEVPPGMLRFDVETFFGLSSFGVVNVERVAPSLFTADSSGQGLAAAVVLRVKADGIQTYEQIAEYDAAQNKFIARPIDLSNHNEQVYLVLFGTGLRKRSSLGAVSVKVGGVETEVLFAGKQEGFVGLDQVNLRLPNSLAGRGEVEVMLTVDGKTANQVRLSVK